MKKSIVIFFFLFIFVAGAAWVVASNPGFLNDATVLNTGAKEKQITIRHTIPVWVDVADTEASRREGLSGRSVLPDNHGLLMIFPEEQRAGIWMKDMNFPIDVLWAVADGTIVAIEQNMAPDSYPHVFYPTPSVRYVLEVPAGFVEAHNITVGDSLDL